MKRRPLTSLALLALTLFSTSSALPVGGGGGGGATVKTCSWVQVPIVVVTGWDRNGFPIMHMELQWRYLCRSVSAP